MLSTAEKIKERLDIVEVIGSYIKLEKAGRNFKARCPFHNEKTPSFSISRERQFFYCFGCQAKGDIFSFVEKFEGLDFKGALRVLADRAGIKLEEYKPGDKEKDRETERLLQIMERSVVLFQENLKEEKEVLKYLEKRGVDQESITAWRIGYAPLDWRRLHDKLIEEGYSVTEILKTGMIKSTEDSATGRGQVKYYDTFRGRIMFPIFDASGRPVAFSGRILVDDPKAPKYLNSPETELFHKSEILYGLNFAKSEVRRMDYAVLVEGQMDLVMSHQVGVRNCVASSGTALSETHLRRLQKISNRIILAYDSDEAGMKAARRSAELALLLGMDVKIALMPEGEDPASMAAESSENWKKCLKDALPVVEFLVDKAVKKAKSGLPLAKEINLSVVPYIALIQNEILRAEYCALTARKTGISESAISAEVVKQKKSPAGVARTGEGEGIARVLSFPDEEVIIGISLWQQAVTDSDFNWRETLAKLEKLLGKERFDSALQDVEADKVALIFKIEKHFENLDLDREVKEKMENLEKELLKNKIASLNLELDKMKNTEGQDKIRLEIKKIWDKLSKMNN